MPEGDPPLTDDPPAQSGGVNITDAKEVSVGGDIVGRDKIVTNIDTFVQRALSAAEEAEQERSFEAQQLAQGVSAFAQRLQDRASESGDAGSPYKGLLEYRLSDAQIFFGRARAIGEVLEKLQSGALTVLHAESGAGKTSLLQAGVSPRLIAAGHLPAYLRPYNVDPALALKRAFLSDPSLTPVLANAPLRDFLRQICGVLGPQTTLYLFFDQFEEFFTRLDEPARTDFVREFAECLEDDGLNVHWVLALRSEYFGNLANFRPRIRNPFENDYRLNRLTRAEAQEGVVAPAAQRGITFEAGLVEIILDDLGKTEIAPPQMQLVCSSLYEELEGETIITRALYEREGGAAGILRGHLERVLSQRLTPAQQTIARSIFLRLTELGEGTQDTRRRARLAELIPRSEDRPAVEAVIKILADARLITTDEGTVEVAHEELIREWPKLREWVALDRAGLRIHRRLTEAVQEWTELEREPGELYRGIRLARAMEWAEEHASELNALEREFLDASRALQVSELEASKRRAAQLRGEAALAVSLGASSSLNVFLCHSNEDKPAVRKLHKDLKAAGLQPWLDEIDILPGQDWELEIQRAISKTDFFLACLSNKSLDKRGYVQKEIKLGLDMLDRMPEGKIYLIPVRLDDCQMPQRLQSRQWVDLFAPDGFDRLLKAMKSR